MGKALFQGNPDIRLGTPLKRIHPSRFKTLKFPNRQLRFVFKLFR